MTLKNYSKGFAMVEVLQLNLEKIIKKHVMSTDRADGIDIDSCLSHTKYILKGNSLVLASKWDGLFRVDLDMLPVLAKELLEISEMYKNER